MIPCLVHGEYGECSGGVVQMGMQGIVGVEAEVEMARQRQIEMQKAEGGREGEAEAESEATVEAVRR